MEPFLFQCILERLTAKAAFQVDAGRKDDHPVRQLEVACIRRGHWECLFVCLFVGLAEYVIGFRSSMEAHCLV